MTNWHLLILIGYLINITVAFTVRFTRFIPELHTYSRTEKLILCVPFGAVLEPLLMFVITVMLTPWREEK